MDDKLLYIPNQDTQNYPLSRLKLFVENYVCALWFNQQINKYPKLNKETAVYKTLGTSPK